MALKVKIIIEESLENDNGIGACEVICTNPDTKFITVVNALDTIVKDLSEQFLSACQQEMAGKSDFSQASELDTINLMPFPTQGIQSVDLVPHNAGDNGNGA